MKKRYLQPEVVVLDISATTPLTLSGNLEEGETTEVGVHDDEINGDDAYVKFFDFQWE